MLERMQNSMMEVIHEQGNLFFKSLKSVIPKDSTPSQRVPSSTELPKLSQNKSSMMSLSREPSQASADPRSFVKPQVKVSINAPPALGRERSKVSDKAEEDPSSRMRSQQSTQPNSKEASKAKNEARLAPAAQDRRDSLKDSFLKPPAAKNEGTVIGAVKAPADFPASKEQSSFLKQAMAEKGLAQTSASSLFGAKEVPSTTDKGQEKQQPPIELSKKPSSLFGATQQSSKPGSSLFGSTKDAEPPQKVEDKLNAPKKGDATSLFGSKPQGDGTSGSSLFGKPTDA